MKYQYLLFDLDGTLTDSGEGIMNSVRYALDKMGKTIPDETVLRRFIGPPLIKSFERYCGMDPEEAASAVKTYREYFSVTGLFENAVYEGIRELLEELRGAGYRLAVATSKPEIYSVRIIEHFKLDGYFDCVAGSSLDESRNTKEAVIRYALDRLGITDFRSVLMIGDRKHDAEGAAACGVDCLGVLWGYGDREELLQAGVAAAAEKPQDILRFLENRT